MTTLSELITTLKGKMLPLTGGTLSGNLEIGGNATVSGKNIVRSINGTVAGTDGNVTLSIPSAYTHPSTHPASMITGLATVATSGKYSDLSGKPSLAKVATSGSYNDLSNRPSIPSSGGFIPNYSAGVSKSTSANKEYTASENGWLFIWMTEGAHIHVFLYVNGVKIGSMGTYIGSDGKRTWVYPIAKGSKYKITNGNVEQMTWYPCIGG